MLLLNDRENLRALEICFMNLFSLSKAQLKGFRTNDVALQFLDTSKLTETVNVQLNVKKRDFKVMSISTTYGDIIERTPDQFELRLIVNARGGDGTVLAKELYDMPILLQKETSHEEYAENIASRLFGKVNKPQVSTVDSDDDFDEPSSDDDWPDAAGTDTAGGQSHGNDVLYYPEEETGDDDIFDGK